MRRFNKLLAGASWMAEYGDPDVPAEWSYLQAYSPYHNLDFTGDTRYPPLLVTTSTKDDRVHPYHARCFVKRMGDVRDLHNRVNNIEVVAEGSDKDVVDVDVHLGKSRDVLMSDGLFYYENIEGGHGGAADNPQQAFMTVCLF